MDREYETFLNRFLTESLISIIGHVLTNVEYGIMLVDLEDFDLVNPNLTGLVATKLTFDTTNIKVYAGWQMPLKETGVGFHIEACIPKEIEKYPLNTELSVYVSASATPLWSPLISQTISSIEIVGANRAPQEIKLCFGDTTVSIVIGSSIGSLIVGDGDEILINPWGNKDNPPVILGHNWSPILNLQ